MEALHLHNTNGPPGDIPSAEPFVVDFFFFPVGGVGRDRGKHRIWRATLIRSLALFQLWVLN